MNAIIIHFVRTIEAKCCLSELIMPKSKYFAVRSIGVSQPPIVQTMRVVLYKQKYVSGKIQCKITIQFNNLRWAKLKLCVCGQVKMSVTWVI